MKFYSKLDANTKGIKCAKILNAMMERFKNTIPLMVSLKNEAMRNRHWNELMTKTGIK